MSNDTNPPKWSDIQHLPEWDEEFYLVYKAKKHGKWVMLKSLRPELKNSPEAREMIEREFETRYNLSHPNIVMINDFEDVPGVGLSIITDDVYGLPLSRLIADNKVTPHHIAQLCERLPHALEYIHENHIVHPPLSADNIVFTDKIRNLKMIDVGFEQRPSLSERTVTDDIKAFGRVLRSALDACPQQCPDARRLRHIADRAASPGRSFDSMASLRRAIDNRSHDRFYLLIIAFMAAMFAVIVWFTANPESLPFN